MANSTKENLNILFAKSSSLAIDYLKYNLKYIQTNQDTLTKTSVQEATLKKILLLASSTANIPLLNLLKRYSSVLFKKLSEELAIENRNPLSIARHNSYPEAALLLAPPNLIPPHEEASAQAYSHRT